MVFRIKFICEEVDGFVREIKIDSDATFLDLNKVILKSCNYPDDQLTSFYLCNDEWERGEQITREDMGFGSSDEDIYVMENTRLSELIEDEEQHLEFVFDPFSNRSFFLDVKEVIFSEHLDEAEIIRSKGEAPQQIEMSNGDPLAPVKGGKKKAVAADDDFSDDNIFGDGAAFNDDEIDYEGFEITDGNPYE
uniref:IS1096 element passenger TnpR family protein n=1 Tax=Alloprevotella sp. TaxID=1872471 RepID=UPI003FEF3A5D